MKELIAIQSKLKAPKTQYNKFGQYHYRSCEDILEAVKPLLKEQGCVLLLSDEVKEVGAPYTYSSQDPKKGENMNYQGTRVYVEATATIINSQGEKLSVKAVAREDVAKKGMDSAQITGSTSSYARKYALNGLFCIDDSKDSDVATNDTSEAPYKDVAIATMRAAANREDAENIWHDNVALQHDPDFIAAAQEVGKKFKKQ